jgi:anion-transporting  ArsA/GET3 family ATPase
MAMETLLSAHEKEQYDLIVVDTPPSPQISDLLSAPRRLTNILDAGFLRWISKSYGIMNSLSFGLTKLWGYLTMGLVEKIVGVEVLRDVWEFFVDFDPISEPLKQRAEAVFELLKSPNTVFLIVTSARKSSLYDSLALYKMLKGEGYRVGAVIANRVYTENGFLISESEIENSLGNRALAGKVLANYANYKRLIEAERESMEEFKKKLKEKIPIITIPCLDNEVYDLERLFELRGYLFKTKS